MNKIFMSKEKDMEFAKELHKHGVLSNEDYKTLQYDKNSHKQNNLEIEKEDFEHNT